MSRDWLKILVCLASEVLILLGAFFIMSMTGGPFNILIVLVFSLLAPSLLILTRVMFWRAARAQKFAGTEPERKTDIEALCEHLRQIGLDATVESKQPLRFRTLMATAIIIYMLIFGLLFIGFMVLLLIAEMQWFGVFLLILAFPMLLFFDPRPSSPDSFLGGPTRGRSSFMGSVRVANRNIDLIELQWRDVNVWGGEYGEIPDKERWYECNYVVQAKIRGLENKLKAETKPVTVREGVVDVIWEGGELAQALNNDASLIDTLYHMKLRDKEEKIMEIKDKYEIPDMSSVARRFRGLFFLKIKPDRKHECVRITLGGGYVYPEYAFPTIETFEAFDRIAQHIRSIAYVHPIHKSGKDLQ